MFSISKYCRALPSLLDLKERGVGPSQFSEQVVGTIDLSPLYLLQGREVIGLGSNAAPVVGGNQYAVVAIVPPGEIWYVWEHNLTATPGVGAAIDMAPSLTYDGVTPIIQAPFQSSGASSALLVAASLPKWATPGTTFGFVIRSITGATTVNGSAVVSKLRL